LSGASLDYAAALGVEPGEVALPTTAAEVGEVVAWANASGKAIIPWAGGTGQTYGYLPRRADVLLDLSGLNRVVAHEPGDLTVTVEGGVTLAQLQDALSLHNQYLPLDPPHADTATAGGILATNAFGPSCLGHGTARDWLIGIAVVDAAGRLIRGGGKVVKNVTGYDLPKLHVGALGTLGVIVEATFKVAPRPESFRALMFADAGPDFLRRLHDETTPAMSLWRTTPHGSVFALIYTGFEEVVASEAEKASAMAETTGAFATGLPAAMPPPFNSEPPPAPLAVRITGDRSGSAARHAALCDSGLYQQVDTFPGVGVTDAYLAPDGDPESALHLLREWARGAKASLAVTHAPSLLRVQGALLWHPLPPSLPLMRRLKETLDPNGTLNPGRFLGGI
jgi:glycolate oxidase FAD binding subunit